MDNDHEDYNNSDDENDVVQAILMASIQTERTNKKILESREIIYDQDIEYAIQLSQQDMKKDINVNTSNLETIHEDPVEYIEEQPIIEEQLTLEELRQKRLEYYLNINKIKS